jgi:hypothetical protein
MRTALDVRPKRRSRGGVKAMMLAVASMSDQRLRPRESGLTGRGLLIPAWPPRMTDVLVQAPKTK